jgi:hypothetical protein
MLNKLEDGPWEGRIHRTTDPLGGRSCPSAMWAFCVELGEAVDVRWRLGLNDVGDDDLIV